MESPRLTPRPLSELSENDDLRRVSPRLSTYSLKTSRPGSVHTITLNLADYSTTAPKSTPPPVCESPTPADAVSVKHKSFPPPIAEKPAELAGRPVKPSSDAVVDLSEPSEGISPLFVATRAALRPTAGVVVNSPVEYYEKLKDESSSSPSRSPSLTSFESPRSSLETRQAKPSRPKWLKRASMTPVLRSKSRSPSGSPVDLPYPEPASPNMHSALPPPLPPRRFPTGPMDAGPSRPPPQHPARDVSLPSSHRSTSQSHRSRWGMGGGSNTVVRSSSHNSIASTSQRVLAHTGHAVTKTLMRARGVGGSMSISGLGGVRGVEPELTSPNPLSRKLSRETGTPPLPEWSDGVVKRNARNGHPRGLVFGRPLDIAGRTWGVFDAAADRSGEDEYSQRRRRCLPAVAIRCVEYLNYWCPREEGIFRMSGRSSHINRLRREFDAGADLDLTLCDPADLDPHAVSSVFKSFIRELPEPMIGPLLEARIDDFAHRYPKPAAQEEHIEELISLISTLSSATWFLLAEVIGLIDLIPRHEAVNRMTHSALMISLGPTLRLPGDHVLLLVRHRAAIFGKPPLVSVADLIDFGSDDELLSLSTPFEGTSPPTPTLMAPTPKPRPMSRISKKPSFGNLLSRGSNSNMRRTQSDHGLSVSPAPPRLAMPERVDVDLPMFVNGTKDDIQEEVEPVHAKATETLVDAHYAPGTVAARTRVFSTSTPIADRFRRISTFQDLRPPTAESISSSASSAGSIRSTHSSELRGDLLPPPNPMSSLRRSPPLFFQSTASMERLDHITSKVVGTKRKDDAGTGEAPGGAKRLSSGPGPED